MGAANLSDELRKEISPDSRLRVDVIHASRIRRLLLFRQRLTLPHTQRLRQALFERYPGKNNVREVCTRHSELSHAT